jgi:hypothetical protein
MTNHQLDNLLTAANPLTARDSRRLPLDEAHDELLAALLDEPAPRHGARPRPRGRDRRLFGRLALAVAGTAVMLIALLSLTDDSGKQSSGTAWAAEQVRFAEASPLVLLDAPGWHVEYADEESKEEGELHIRRSADGSLVDLNWRGGPLQPWLDDRAASSVRITSAPVLDTTAHVYQYMAGTPGHRDITALFRYDGRVLEFRGVVTGLGEFKDLLAKLKRVDTDTWLSAMPASVVKTADRGSTVDQMLNGVVVPPGFEPKDIRGSRLTKDRYQLGTAVVGTVACQWFERWGDARRAHEAAKERAAIAALATAKNWPIMKELAKHGGYPEVLIEYAAAMPSGTWYGRPLLGDVESGLGCRARGVDLR